MFANMRWDVWELVGLTGECLFFARMFAQWLASERAKRPVIPVVYWYLSLAGTFILIVYALRIGSFAVLLPQVVGVFFYARGLHLDHLARKRDHHRHALGLDRPDHSWPSVSVIVPVHNEEKALPATLDRLIAQRYPGPRPEIVVGLNGCSDGSGAIARRYPVRLVEEERSGMSFGKNIAGRVATGELLVFVDADTAVPDDALKLLAEAAAGKRRFIGTVAGRADRGGGVVRACFWIANRATRRKRAHAPGGVMLMDRDTFSTIGGFDETLPQGTSTDCIRRGLAAGAEYVFVDSFRATTSIRRFERTGIVRQMLDWRKNHKAFEAGRRGEIEGKAYEDVR